MRKIIVILICFLLLNSICFANEYPISQQTLQEIFPMMKKFTDLMQDLYESNRSEHNELYSISNISYYFLFSLGVMLKIESSHAQKNQFDYEAINTIKYYINMFNTSGGSIDMYLKYDNGKLSETSDPILINYLQRNKECLRETRNLLEKIIRELSNGNIPTS